MSRILVVYSTRAGTTEYVGNLLAQRLRTHAHEVTVASAMMKPSPQGFDFFVVGSSIIASAWNPEGISWLQAHKEILDGKTALFNVSLTAADPAQREEALELNKRAASIVTPLAREAFAGRYEPKHVSWWQRLFLRAIQKPPQDHLNPDAVAAWADELDAIFAAASGGS